MARDIEEFLRKAAERRKQQQAQKQGGAASMKPKSPPPVRQWPAGQPIRRNPQPEIVEAVEVFDDEIIEAQPAGRRQSAKSSSHRKSVQSDVQSHIDTSKIADHADGLGRLRAQMTDDVDEVKQKFDRGAKKFDSKRSGQKERDSEIVSRNVSQAATDLIQMLRDPKSVQQAILMSEILRRPDFDE